MIQAIKLEKFTISRYNKYLKNQTPMRLVTDRGRDCKLIAILDDNNVVFEEHYTVNDKPSSALLKCDGKGKSWYDQVYIWTGCIDLNKGDMYIDYFGNSAGEGFFFYGFFDGICTMEHTIGYGQRWEMDCYGGQFDCARTFNDLRHLHYIRKATPEEEEKYWQLLLAVGWERNEAGTIIHQVPVIGDEYWSVEMENGIAMVQYHNPIETEDQRPFGHHRCYTYEQSAMDVAKSLNEKIL